MFLETFTVDEKKALFSLAEQVVHADGFLSEEEVQTMERIAEFLDAAEFSLSEEESYKIITSADEKRKKEFFVELVSLALVDGKYDPKEKACLQKIQSKIGLNDAFADDAAKWILSYYDVMLKGKKLVGA